MFLFTPPSPILSHSSFHGFSTVTPISTISSNTSPYITYTTIPRRHPSNITIECKRHNQNPRSSSPSSTTSPHFHHTDGRRRNRVGELIRREIGAIIDNVFAREVTRSGDAAAGGIPMLISVVDVKCSDDLRNARINISLLGAENEDEKRKTFEWLKTSRREIRYKLAQCVRMKYIPDLSFHESEMEDAVNTVTILNQLERQRQRKQKIRGNDLNDVVINTDEYGNKDELDYDSTTDDDGLIFDEDDDDDGLVIVNVEGDDDEGEEDGQWEGNARS